MSNKVYITTSLDGYIAYKNGSVNWLSMVPMDKETQTNFSDFMDIID